MGSAMLVRRTLVGYSGNAKTAALIVPIASGQTACARKVNVDPQGWFPESIELIRVVAPSSAGAAPGNSLTPFQPGLRIYVGIGP